VELINAVTALGKPTITVLSIGGPYAPASVIDKLPAVLTNYYGGPYQANAVADALFGVTNTGQRRGTEVVQLHAADTATGVTLPAQQLVGFTRVDLEPGASKTVTLKVPMSLLAYTGISGEVVMELGPVELSAGSSSSDIRSTANLAVTGKTRTFKGGERAFLSVATVGQ
jgi:beta-glucosidase